LEGGWSPPNNNTNITYNALPAGDYIFHGRCIDSRGKFSEEILIPFTIRQAFYRTWWFFLICGTILGLLVIGAFRVRLTREREANEKERLEYKSRLLTLEQRSLNASMNRHFIFNSLNSIQYFINTQDKLSANRFLTNFAKLIRKNLDSSEEGNMVTLSQEIERLDLYLSLESMRFKDRFDYKIDCDPAIDLDAVVIPAMILQPFVENSIIHGILPDESKKGNIQIKIYIEEDNMVIEITDNGIGIDQSKKGKSDYDGDHRSQGMEITSKRIELLNKLSDRKFEIKGPFQIEDNYHLIKGTGVILKMQLENLED
jgi:two-component sensor histidine kinase